MTDAQNTTAAPADDGALRREVAHAACLGFRGRPEYVMCWDVYDEVAEAILPLINAREATLRQENAALVEKLAVARRERERAVAAALGLQQGTAAVLREVERERDEAKRDAGFARTSRDAAGKIIKRQETRIAVLEAALRPFAEAADAYDPDEGDSDYMAWSYDFSIGLFRRARAALTAQAEGGRDV